MSGSVDDEVVRMRFDNNAFERGVSTTISTLSKLKNALSFSGAGKGLSDIEAKASSLDMSGANKQIDQSAGHWSAWRTAGLIAFAMVVHRALNSAASVAKAFTLGPIIDGFHEYETQLNSVQTILANTGLKGSSGMKQVNGALNELNTYSDKTIYNFSEMARNIGTFTAAGVKLKPATAAIKGIANVAALSGSSSDQASTAMYQLSQAIANNKVGLQDWNSVVNAGMGGKVFQQALFNVGKMKGTLKGVGANTTFDQWTKSGNSFRDSLKDGWITGDVLTTTLSQFTGDLTDAQLKSQGYNKTQIKQIQEQAKTAQDAATKVKTFTQLMGTLKEAVGSGWSQSFLTIFGNFDEAKTLWTGVSQSIGGVISNSSKARNKILNDWKALGGRTQLINGIQSAFTALGSVLKPFKDAFREIFPRKTGQDLYDLTAQFANFMKSLKIGPETAANLKRTFAGFFAILDIGKQIVSGIYGVFVTLFSTMLHGSGGFLNMTGNIGDMVVQFDKALRQGGLLNNFFQIIANVLTIPLHLFHLVGVAIGEMFKGFHKKDSDGMTNSVTNAGDALGRVVVITQKVSDWFGSLSGKIRPGVDAVVNGMKKIGSALADALGSQSFANILSGLQTGLLAGIVLLLKKFFANGFNVDIGNGFLGKAGEALDGLTGNLKAMQMQLKAKALLEIAGAIGIITASVVALSLINATKLQTALKAMAVGFGELLGAMAILTKISGSAGFIKIPLMAASLDMLAVAILLLTAAVAAMSMLSWDQLERGLTAVGVLLLALSIASYPLSANSAGMIRAGVGIAAIALALNLLYFAVKNFATMSWGDMAKGLGAVGVALFGIAKIMGKMPPGMLAQSAGILLLSVALNALYLAVREFASLSYPEMIKGLIGVALSLRGIAFAMDAMPRGMIAQAAAMVIIAGALLLIGKAISQIGGLSVGTLAKGLIGMGVALGIIAIALDAMEAALPGALALIVAAKGISILTGALIGIARLSIAQIVTGLLTMAASFAVIGVAALLLEPVIPMMLGLGVALGLVGVGMLAFGAGAALLGVGLTAIAASGGAAIGVLLSGLKGLLALLPVAAKSIATALVSFITIIGSHAPQIIGAFVSLLNGLLQAIPKIIPSLIVAIGSIIQGILKVLVDNAPKIIQAGFDLLMDLLKGIRNNIGNIVGVVADIIVKFLNALASNIGKIIAAGVNLLTKFLVGVASALGKMPGVVLKVIAAFLTSLFGSYGKIFSAGNQMLGKLLGGILGNIGRMASAAVSLVGRFLSGIAGKAGDIAAAGARMISKLVGGLLGAVGDVASNLASAGWDIAKHLIDGIISGIKDLAGSAMDAVKNLGGGLISKAKSILHIGGPSQVFHDIGADGIGGGLINGMNSVNSKVNDAAQNMGRTGVLAMKKTFAGLGQAISDSDIDFNPTVAPVLDLSQFTKDAAQMGALVAVSPVNASLSYSQAADISTRQQAAQEAAATTPATAPAPSEIKFEQNNYSPKALSTVDVYRQTNNQLAQARKSLGLAAVPSTN